MKTIKESQEETKETKEWIKLSKTQKKKELLKYSRKWEQRTTSYYVRDKKGKRQRDKIKLQQNQ